MSYPNNGKKFLFVSLKKVDALIDTKGNISRKDKITTNGMIEEGLYIAGKEDNLVIR